VDFVDGRRYTEWLPGATMCMIDGSEGLNVSELRQSFKSICVHIETVA